MKEKIKKIFNWLFQRWVKFAEVIVVVWAINGMFSATSITHTLIDTLSYFLPAVLILYLLRKYEKEKL